MKDPKEVKDWDLKFEDPEEEKLEVPSDKSEEAAQARLPSEKANVAA